jgi:hypothetical protein
MNSQDEVRPVSDSEPIWIVPVASLLDLADPMSDDIWGVGVITPEEVAACRDNSIGKIPYSLVAYGHDSREYHIARIAWLADNGWDDSEYPVSVDLYADASYTWHPIIDGNHRFAASILLGRDTIQVSVNGDLDYALEILKPINVGSTF